MVQLVSHEDVKTRRTQKTREDGKWSARTDFLLPADRMQPQAFLAELEPHLHLRTHFHECDQFQLIVAGGGTLGQHAIAPVQVHFARRFTPYGPLIADEQGVSFFTLRPERDPGLQHLPEGRAALEAVPDRDPWQMTQPVHFPASTDMPYCEPIAGLQDDRGLAAFAISLPPGARLQAPEAGDSGGQYLVVLEGSLVCEGAEHEGRIVMFREPGEALLPMNAGPQGLRAVALNFPRRAVTAPSAHGHRGAKVWECALCGFAYDEAVGLPDAGIAPGTRWPDVPTDFHCPDCDAVKADFTGG